jgi:hypothetical protein
MSLKKNKIIVYMKLYLLFISFFIFLFASCQTPAKPLLISTSGIDSIKIGMSKPTVEKVINARLKPYITPDSIQKKQDTAMLKNACKDCNENFTCNYNGVELLLTFFRYTMYQKSDFELVAITPTSTLPVIETKGGIKVGTTEKEFIAICKKNKYKYHFNSYNLTIDLQSRGCFFTDNLNLDEQTAKVLMIRFSNGIATSLAVVNMIGD